MTAKSIVREGEEICMDWQLQTSSKKSEITLANEKVMGAFSLEWETQLVVDRNPHGIAATVMQPDVKKKKNSERRPINYISWAKISHWEELLTS